MSEECRTASERLSEVFDARPEIADRPNARALDHPRGRLELRGVGFKYPKSDEWILRDLNLVVEPGETVGLVGRTGSGKTSIAYLVPRLYDVSEGSVMLDGVDVRDITLRSLRSHIGVAFEDPILFSASVHENLVMAGRRLRRRAETRHRRRAGGIRVGPAVGPRDPRRRAGLHVVWWSAAAPRPRAGGAGAPPVLVLDDPLSRSTSTPRR